jgi:hypothetical protein
MYGISYEIYGPWGEACKGALTPYTPCQGVEALDAIIALAKRHELAPVSYSPGRGNNTRRKPNSRSPYLACLNSEQSKPYTLNPFDLPCAPDLVNHIFEL